MTRFLGVAVTALAFVSANHVSAQTFSSTSGTYTFSGSSVKFQKGNGPTLFCTLSIDLTNVGGNITADNPVITGLSGLCDTIDFSFQPWPVSQWAGTYTIGSSADPVYVATSVVGLGDCSGEIQAHFSMGPWMQENLTINFGFPPIASTMPEVSGGGDCKMDGTISW
jgi:hypothetical protein